MNVAKDNLLISKKELLNICPGFKKYGLDWLIRERKIPIIKIGRRIYFDPNEIRTWINSNKVEPD